VRLAQYVKERDLANDRHHALIERNARGAACSLLAILLMAVAQQSQEQGRRGARRALWAFVAERSLPRAWWRVRAKTFQGPLAEMESGTARQLQEGIVLLFLAVRCVHLGQAGVDLALAGRTYTIEWLALALAVLCAVESLAVAAVVLGPRARRLTARAILADAAFGVVGLGVMALATTSGPGRAGSLNWMLPYTVATATGLGALAAGDLVDRSAAGASLASLVDRSSPGASPAGVLHQRVRSVLARLWPLALALGLGGAYVASAYLPHRLGEDQVGQIWGNAANYPGFFLVGAFTVGAARFGVRAISARNAELSEATAQVAQEMLLREVEAEIFSPALALLDRVVDLEDGEVPDDIRREAGQLISMIDAVEPRDRTGSLEASEEARG
jgi:hypothetical protein